NFALAKHWGMSACLNGGFRGQYGGELAGIYYKRFNDNNYFETQVGYGYNKNQTNVEAAWSFMAGETGTWYYRNTDVRYHKIFVQPTYAIRDQNKVVLLGLKISANYFDKYYYRCSITDQEDYKNSSTIVQSDFRYRWCMTFEPSMKILFNKFFYLQFSGLISTSAEDTQKMFEVRDHKDGLISSEVLGNVGNPQHLGFLATIGFEIKMGKKKDKVKDEKNK
ncbi:MAG: hypothetical protein WCL06_09830, partial [Bacteroidota bacterium]